ncbi:MAG: type I pullulanase [Spirochaetales bacterium]|nr:type I pullulanase [Spirochaetales bacterium]
MKRIINLIFTLIVSMLFVFSCADPTTDDKDNNKSNSGGSNEEKVAPGTIEPTPEEAKIVIAAREKLAPTDEDAVLFYYRPDGNYEYWNLWVWADGADGIAVHFADPIDVDGKKVAYVNFNNNSEVSSAISDILNSNGKVNFIVRKSTPDEEWKAKDPGTDQSWQLSWGRFFAVISGSSNVWVADANAKPQITSATMISQLEMKLTLSCKYAIKATPSDNGFKVKADDGSEIKIENMRNFTYRTSDKEKDLKNKNYTTAFWVKLAGPVDLDKTWKVSHSSFIPDVGLDIGLNEVYSVVAAETEAVNETLGAIYTPAKTTFKVWAPLASDVNLLIYDDWKDAKKDGEKHNVILTEEEAAAATTANNGVRTQMTLDKTTGVWSAEVAEDLKGKYYTYEINNGGDTNRICDIYANAAAPDSVAGQIVDLATDTAAQPTGWEAEYTNPFTGSYTDAVIYEMHVRDWSKAYGGDGKFIELANSAEFIAHLKDLGITHVQILPAFDYAEKNEDPNYNWGYNPYQYNVPEGRYVVDHDTDGRKAVKDFRELILALHNAGIAVNMDVVYNHTNGTGEGSLFDMTVPGYYYRLSNGAYSNGSGCGNETASNTAMFKKYIIESLKHWMNDYHVNGFRFDLMGLHEIETMKEIYAALKEIDSNVMVYGEPWNGGTAAVKNGITSASKNKIDEMDGVGMFNDNIRNAIKGAEFGGFQHGFVQGKYEDKDNKDLIAEVIEGLKGSPSLTKFPGRSLNYVECHDNYTLFDKLAMSYLEIEERDSSKGNLLADLIAANGLNAVKAQNKMCAAIIFLAQGTPFINGGQEFMRTKNGDHNSYKSSDDVNAIDMSFVETNKDVYNVYKGLIALRKANPKSFGANAASATKAADGVVKYTAGDFMVYFNSAKAAFDIDTTGYSKVVDVTSGAVVESDALPANVAAGSFVILKK